MLGLKPQHLLFTISEIESFLLPSRRGTRKQSLYVLEIASSYLEMTIKGRLNVFLIKERNPYAKMKRSI